MSRLFEIPRHFEGNKEDIDVYIKTRIRKLKEMIILIYLFDLYLEKNRITYLICIVLYRHQENFEFSTCKYH